MKILQPFLSLSGLAERAVAHAHKIVERWDVPHAVEVDGKLVPVPADLDDRTPRMWGLGDGRRITSVLTLDELATGGPNPAMPLIIGLIPFATLLLFVLPPSFSPLAALVFALGAALTWRVAGFKVAAVAAILSNLPIYGQALHERAVLMARAQPGGSFGGMQFHSAPDAAWHPPIFSSVFQLFSGMLGPLIIGLMVLFAVVLLIVILSSDKNKLQQNQQYQPKRKGLVHTGRSFLLLLAVVVVSLIASSRLPICAYIPMVIFPAWYVRRECTAYLRQLAAMDHYFPGESLIRSDTHVNARLKQAINAVADRSPYITLGTATGTLTAQLDGFAPDAGMPVGLTFDDLSQHMLVVGEPGSGKTSCVLRPLIKQYVDAKAGGMLVLDGEKGLPAEVKGLPGYICIDPSVDLGLIEGLEPADVVRALASVGSHFKSKAGSGEKAFFIATASTMIFHCSTILKALVQASIDEYEWNLHCLYNLMINLNANPRKEGERLTSLLANFSSAIANDDLLLANALTYVVSAIPGLASDTRSNIWATVQSWFDPIFQHPELVRWTHITHGVDIAKIDTGGLFGVSLPEVRYGEAGLLVTSLTKERVFNIVRRRVTNPSPGQKKILIVADECQNVIGDSDEKFLPIARELGGLVVYASQSIDAFKARISGEKAANAFLATFKSQVMLRASEESINWLVSRLGTTLRPTWKGPSAAINYVASLDSLAAASISDVAHEGTPLYRSLRRQGAGQFKYGNLYGRDYGHVDDLHVQALTTVEFEEKPLISLGEADSHLAEPFIAIVQVQRGNVRRRDFVQLTPMFGFEPAPVTAKAA